MLKEILKQKLPIVLILIASLLLLLSIFKIEDITKLKFAPHPTPAYSGLVIGIVLLLISIGLFIWSERKTNLNNGNLKENKLDKNQFKQRISLMGVTTDEIENSEEKKKAIIKFYKSFIEEIQRTKFGINACGAQPLRSAFIQYYCDKLFDSSRAHMRELDKRLRWYWFRGDNRGLNFEPGCYEAIELPSIEERTISEVNDSALLVIWAGRTGTYDQLAQLLHYHKQHQHGINFNKKTFIILGWFGGSIKKYIDENRDEVDWIMKKYPELDPYNEIVDWYKGNNPEMLANRLIKSIQRLLS